MVRSREHDRCSGRYRRSVVLCRGFDRAALQEAKKRVPLFELVRQHVRSFRSTGANRYMCLCPFHEERSASLLVDNERGSYRCFGCGARGDAVRFLMDLKQIDFRTAAQELLTYASGVTYSEPSFVSAEPKRTRSLDQVPAQLECVSFEESIENEDFSIQAAEQEQVLRLNALAFRFFRQQLEAIQRSSASGSTEARDVLRYLYETRNLTAHTVDVFGIGYAPLHWRALVQYMLYEQTEIPVVAEDLILAGLAKTRHTASKGDQLNGRALEQSLYDVFRGRIMIPIRDVEGRVVGFGGRQLEFTRRVETESRVLEHVTGNGAVTAYPSGPSVSPLFSALKSTGHFTAISEEIRNRPLPSKAETAVPTLPDETIFGPKYLNTPETPAFHKSRILFGMAQVMERIRSPEAFADDWATVDQVGPCVILVEGYLDVLRLHQEGIWFAVAALGTSVTPSHFQLLVQLAQHLGRACAHRLPGDQRPRIILQLDQDEAGIRATKRTLDMFLDQLNGSGRQPFYDLLVAELPSGVKDADEFVQRYGRQAYLTQVVAHARIWWRHEIMERMNAYVAAVEASRRGIAPENDVTRLFWRWSPALNDCLEDIATLIRRAHLSHADSEALLTMVASEIGRLYVPFHGLDDPCQDLANELRIRIQDQPVRTHAPPALRTTNGRLSASVRALKEQDKTLYAHTASGWRGSSSGVPLTAMPAPFNSYPPWIRAELKLLRVVVCGTATQRQAWQQNLIRDSIPLLDLITMSSVRRAIAYLLGLEVDSDGAVFQAGRVCPLEDAATIADTLFDDGILHELDMANLDTMSTDNQHYQQQRQLNEHDTLPRVHQNALDPYLIPKEVFSPVVPQTGFALLGGGAPSSTAQDTEEPEQPVNEEELYIFPPNETLEMAMKKVGMFPEPYQRHGQNGDAAGLVSMQPPNNDIPNVALEDDLHAASDAPSSSISPQLHPHDHLYPSADFDNPEDEASSNAFRTQDAVALAIRSIGVLPATRTNNSEKAPYEDRSLTSSASGSGPVSDGPHRGSRLQPRERPWAKNHSPAVSVWLHVDREGADDEFAAQVAWLQYLRCQVRLVLTWQSWSAAVAELQTEIARMKAARADGADGAARGGAPASRPPYASLSPRRGIGAGRSISPSLQAALALLDGDVGRRCQAYLNEINAISEEMVRLEKCWQSEGKPLLNALRRLQ